MNCLQKRLRRELKQPCAIKVYCPAKLNLYLNILGKYQNGFHRIESIVNRIDLTDILTITYRRSSQITLQCNIKSLENDSNLCVRASELIRKKANLKGGFHLNLIKHIPHGAGLGGGSSDAASTLIGINKLLKIGLTQKDLYCLGEKLGSDVNFFLSQKPFAYLSQRGESVKPFECSFKLDYCLVYPHIPLSTQIIYKRAKVKLTKFLGNANIIYHALRHKNKKLLEKRLFNALEASAFMSCEQLKKYRKLLKTLGFTMSGSGSTFFKIVHNSSEYTQLKKHLPKTWKVCRARGL